MPGQYFRREEHIDKLSFLLFCQEDSVHSSTGLGNTLARTGRKLQRRYLKHKWETNGSTEYLPEIPGWSLGEGREVCVDIPSSPRTGRDDPCFLPTR